MSIQKPNEQLDYLVDSGFQRVNKGFVLSFKDNAQRTRHTVYFLPKVEIKDNNVMIDGQNVFHQPVKNDMSTYDNVQKNTIDQGDDCTTGYFLYYLYVKRR